MTIAAYVKYPSSVNSIAKGDNIATDTWKIALAASVNLSDTAMVPGTTDLATGNGYTAGGNAAAFVSANMLGGVTKLILASPAQWTATGAGFTYRYAILYNATTNVLYGYWDYGSSQIVSADEDVAVILDQVNGVFEVS